MKVSGMLKVLVSCICLSGLMPSQEVQAFFQSDTVQDRLEEIINSESRAMYNKVRDKYRHPLETLTFLGIKPDMTVAEIWPGGDAYYAEIVGQYVAYDGQYIAVVPSLNPKSDSAKRNNERLAYRFDNFEDLFESPITTDMSKGDYDFAEDASLDMVLTFRNYHNWLQGGYADNVLAAFMKALKKGGRLAIVEHRLEGSRHADMGEWGGYMTQSHLIELVEEAGFKFIASSEVNANPRDTKDYSAGVWTLPPTLRMGDKDREKYKSIGESDRMTLLFEKP